MAVVLELRDVSKRFGSHLAVDGVSLRVEEGSLFSLVGPSGCGKTTVLRVIAGLEQPTTGEVLLNGENIADLPPYHRPVTTVFQNYALFPHLSVRGNVEFGLLRRRVTQEEVERRVRAVIELVHLTGKENRRPAELSGGERQRVALARSLVLEPKVLLLDEPLAALDPNLRKLMREELKGLQQRVGITFVLVTHDQEEALSLSTTIAVMNKGRVEQVGSPQELYLRPRTRFIAGFLGAVNWIRDVAVRPESMRITREAPAQGVHGIRATVEQSTFLGNCFHVRARLPWGETATAEVSRLNRPFETGEPVHVWWHPQDEMTGLEG